MTMTLRRKLVVGLSLGLVALAPTRVRAEETTGSLPPPEPLAPILERPRASVLLDLFTPLHLQGGSGDGSRTQVRSLEVTVSGALDADLEAQVTLAGHEQAGIFATDLHEAFITSSHLMPHARLRVGRFLLPLGRLNSVPRPLWPYTSAPKYHTRFFSDNVVADTGVEATFGESAPGHPSVALGVTNGYTFGHENLPGDKPLAPTHFVRPLYRGGDEDRSFELGATYVARTDGDATLTRIAGVDFALGQLSREGATTASAKGNYWLSEILYRYQKAYGLPVNEDAGGSVFFETGASERLRAGLRLEAFTTLSLRKENGDKQNNFEWGAMPSLSYQAGPSTRLRVSYLYLTQKLEGNSDRFEQRLELQLVAGLSSSPSR